MEVYLLRHGIAEASASSDAERALTGEGRLRLRRVLEHARAAGVSPSLVLSSPLRRAVETAELACEVLGHKNRIVRTDVLAPGGTPEQVWSEIRARRNETAILLAGHEPLLSQTLSYFLGTTRVIVNFRKGALARIDFERSGGAPQGILQWMLTPKLTGASET